MKEIPIELQMTLTRNTMNVMDSWNLTPDEMRELLGLPDDVRSRSFQKYRMHQPFPNDEDVLRRADYVMRIAGALRTTYPANPQMGPRWLRQPNRRLGNPPLMLMLRDGEDGMIQVLAELDCTFGWEMMSRRPA